MPIAGDEEMTCTDYVEVHRWCLPASGNPDPEYSWEEIEITDSTGNCTYFGGDDDEQIWDVGVRCEYCDDGY